MTYLETRVERLLDARIRAVGGMTFKLMPVHKGMPDRLVVLPDGALRLVELKAPGGRLSPMQHVMHGRLRRLGVEVEVIPSVEAVVLWVKDQYTLIDERRRRKPGPRRKKAPDAAPADPRP